MMENRIHGIEETVNSAKPGVKKLVQLVNSLGLSLTGGNIAAARDAAISAQSIASGLTEKLDECVRQLSEPAATYLSSAEYFVNLQSECKKVDLELIKDGDQWYCFPSVLTPAPQDEVVIVNGTRVSEVMPSKIAAMLKAAAVQFNEKNSKEFLELLLRAYRAALAIVGSRQSGAVISVADLYSVLTLWPEKKRKYSKADFVLDLYALDRSGLTTVSGQRLGFAASTGVRDRTKVLQVRDEQGGEKVYYGIYFVPIKDGDAMQ